MKIGVMSESFRKPFVETVKIVSKLGIDGIQAYASTIFKDGITKSGITEIKNVMEGENVKFSAICGDFGCDMFYNPDKNRELIDKEKKVLELAKELGTSIVTTHIGAVSENKNCIQYETMQKVCYELASFADSVNGKFAVETGPEKARVLCDFLDSLNSRGVSVNLDPANLVMCAGDDPVRAVYTLKKYIVHTHAKDGKQKIVCDPRRIYASSYYNLEPAPKGCWEEYPLGKGDVDWNNYIKALKDIGYDGFLTVERECGDTPEKDINLAVEFLRNKI